MAIGYPYERVVLSVRQSRVAMGSNLVVEPLVHGEKCIPEDLAVDVVGGPNVQFYGRLRDTEMNGLRGSEVGGKIDRWI